MTRRITFAVRAWSPAPPPVVYRLLSDGASWPSWSPIGSFQLEREGAAGGESEGAIRVFGRGGLSSRELLVELRPGESIAYELLSGLPLRGHRAEVELLPQDGGTAIVWHEAFEPALPGSGWLLHAFLRWFMQRCASGLAARAGAHGPATDGPLT
ncbi:MAG: SRPBCC family protein [Gemmatimonadota bacterium]